MIWLALVLAAGPFDDVHPLRVEGRAVEATAMAQAPIAGKHCTFTPRTLSDASVHQWVAACPVEFAQLTVDHGVAGVRLFTQQNIWRLLAFDATRVAEFDDPGNGLPSAPPWVPAAVVAELVRQQKESGKVVARDPRDGTAIQLDYQGGGYQRVRNGQPTPLFSPMVGVTPLHALWFTAKDADPWLFWGDDPWHKLEFWVRAPDGTTKSVFSSTPRPNGGDYRATALTHVVRNDGRPVFSLLADARHLVFWPRDDGTFTPLVQGVGVPGLPPTLEPRPAEPCSPEGKTVLEERVLQPAVFTVRDEVWAAWVSDEAELKWRRGPVLRVGKGGGPSCDWILDARAPHRSLVLAKFTAQGRLEEKKRLPIAGAAAGLELQAHGDVVTIATTAYGYLTLTEVDLRR